MEVNELPQFDPNVDYNVILPIHQKRTIAFVNHFVMNTVSFLNNFYESCESRLIDFEYKLQKVEASLLILEAQLASIPDIDIPAGVVAGVKAEEEGGGETLDLPEIGNEESGKEENGVVVDQKVKEVKEEGPKASLDPRFSRFFKMVQFGVPPQAVKLKMAAEGVNPDILEKPNEVIPGNVPKSEQLNTDSSESS